MTHPHLMTDQELVNAYQKGNDHALAELLVRYKERIYSVIFYLVRNRELAEDLFQDCFVKIITSLRRKNYDEQGKFLPWALCIARNIVLDYFRTQKNKVMIRETDEWSPFDILPERDLNPIEKIIEDEKTAAVRLMIERLPDHQREVVILRHYGGLSFKEISKLLKININTCVGRMHYAVIELRKMAGVTKKEIPN
ncbi:sigma-70 family RNA polymerase sigma factor [soil metagenome]